MSETIRLVNDATALLSMRESDFDAYSAYGEVVDNSIQAGATCIQISQKAAPSQQRGGYEPIIEIAFGDDGCGMDADILQRCLQLGYSSRYNDRKGIGRFGVGMTLGAINQCQRVEVYSKIKNGTWFWTYIDIQEIMAQKSGETSIPEPVQKSPPDTYKHLVGDASGTLVVWRKYDRQPESAHKMLDKMRVWLGRTYRYFIWDENLKIFVNAEVVKAIDPLYVRWEQTNFPNDPLGEEFPPISFSWPVPSDLQQVYGKEESEIKIRMGLVHESLRPTQGSGNSNDAKKRHITDNEGISILRNRREVFYGHVPYWPGKSGSNKTPWFSEIDRWWGCEIHFDPILDQAFTVKNIKRGAVPVTELKKAIYDQIKPTRDTCLEKVRDLWSQRRRKEQEDENERQGAKTGHELAENVAKKTPTDKSLIDQDKDFNKSAEELLERRHKEASEEQKSAWKAKWQSQPFTIHDNAWRGPDFFETNHMGGSDVLDYNLQHPFFEEIYSIINQLESTSEEYESAIKLKQLIDLLLIAYSKAEAKFEGDLEIKVEDFVEQMRTSWGSYLSSYLRTWLKEKDS